MSNVNYNIIIEKLNKLKCPRHDKNAPCVINDGEPIFLNCCCLEFEQELTRHYYDEIDKQLSEDD